MDYGEKNISKLKKCFQLPPDAFQIFATILPSGLSLGYDIVKAHGGKLKVKPAENDAAEFIVEYALQG